MTGRTEDNPTNDCAEALLLRALLLKDTADPVIKDLTCPQRADLSLGEE